MTRSPISAPPGARRFYDEVYAPGAEPDAAFCEGREDWERALVEAFLRDADARGASVLEVGCGHAPYQNRVERYVGVDISRNCAAWIGKPFAAASAVALPFADRSFGAVLTLHTLEHVHDPERALEELHRVLAPGGRALLLPSWYVRPWAPHGLRVRSYADLPPRLRAVKFFMPILNAPLFRALRIFPRRLARLAAWRLSRSPRLPLRWTPVAANYETFIDSDSDACASIDPFDVILWFHARGCAFPELPGWRQQLLFRTGALLVERGGE
ncbi:MAG: class I SAM-dependent methyltransferase [Ignavibacteria bacterium]|nr:class I SAM-dependent methyltransferase [Ignavibacteria bacterium]